MSMKQIRNRTSFNPTKNLLSFVKGMVPFRKNSTLLVLFAILSAVVSCADSKSDNFPGNDSAAEDFQGIINGTLIPPSHQLAKHVFSLRLHYEHKPDRTYKIKYCTASAIHKRIILSAAHCLPPAKDTQGYVIFRNSDGTDNRIKVKEILPHKEYSFVNDQIKNDIALFYLADDLPKDIASVSLFPIKNNSLNLDQIQIAGFGRTDELVDPTSRDLRGGYAQFLNFNSDNKTFITDNGKQASVCYGDSGGPALVQRSDGKMIVVGVASTVVYTDSTRGRRCRQQALYTNIGYYSDWIIDGTTMLLKKYHGN